MKVKSIIFHAGIILLSLTASCATQSATPIPTSIHDLIASSPVPGKQVILRACADAHRHGISLFDCKDRSKAISLEIPQAIEDRPEIIDFFNESAKNWDGKKRVDIEAIFIGSYKTNPGSIPSRIFVLDELKGMVVNDRRGNR